jgi:steroid 5-alpha reductase family enzyme
MFACLMIYMVGLILVMLTDAQKYLVLRERKGLITHCMMGWSRNMNYVGEILLYAAIGLLVQRWETWMIFSYMWGVVFVVRMLVKDYSLSKKEGWPEYYHKTWFLVPKLNNSALFSAIVYSLALAAGYVFVTNGFERTLKQLFLE